MTVVDLRPYAAQLSNLTGDIFIGFSVPTGGVWATITQPGVASRSFTYSSSGSWTAAMSGSASIDFHFRAVVAPYCPPLNVGFTANTTQSPTVVFNDTTNPAPSAWYWDFGDGYISMIQNPTHTYSGYGNYTVKLKVGNSSCGYYDSTAQNISLTALAPVARFVVDSSLSPAIFFTDSSTNIPTQWLWDFDDNGATSTIQNPVHTFPAAGGTFHVCLTATNSAGNDTYCEDIYIKSTIGIEEVSADERVEVYPNPMHDKAFILLQGLTSAQISVRLYDVQGREVHLRYHAIKDGIEIFRDDLADGHYFYEVYQNNRKIKSGRLMTR
jgi:PKD repeat protein